MTSITIPAVYSKWVIKPLKDIKKIPSKVYVTLEYNDSNDLSEKMNSLYEKWDNKSYWPYNDINDFLSELKK